MYNVVTTVDNTVLYNWNFLRVAFKCSHQKQQQKNLCEVIDALIECGDPFRRYTYVKSSHFTLRIHYNFICQLYLKRGKETETPGPSLSSCAYTQAELRQGRMRRQLSKKQEVGLHQGLNLPTPWSRPSQPPELWEISSCSLSHAIRGILS